MGGGVFDQSGHALLRLLGNGGRWGPKISRNSVSHLWTAPKSQMGVL